MCDCITTIDAKLAEKNASLPIGINFTTGGVNLIIRLDRVNSRKPLGSAFIVPSFCPFCGEAANPGGARDER